MGKNSIILPTTWLLICAGAALSQDRALLDQELKPYDARLRNGDMLAVEEIAGKPESISIPLLQQLAFRQNFAGEDAKYPGVGARAAELLGTIPGHAERCAKGIDEATQRYKITKTMSKEDYNRYRFKAFDMLALLNTDESIDVICGYLNDTEEETPPAVINEEWRQMTPNGRLASYALTKMDLPDAPPGISKSDSLNDTNVALWTTWAKTRQKREVMPPASIKLTANSQESVAPAFDSTLNRKSAQAPGMGMDQIAGWAAVILGLIVALWLLIRMPGGDIKNG